MTRDTQKNCEINRTKNKNAEWSNLNDDLSPITNNTTQKHIHEVSNRFGRGRLLLWSENRYQKYTKHTTTKMYANSHTTANKISTAFT